MLKIRLSKFGVKNAPTYRIVVSETRSKRDGKNLDSLGFYDPNATNKFSYDKKKYSTWVKKGAIPTKAVMEMIEGKYIFKKYEHKEEKKAEENENNS